MIKSMTGFGRSDISEGKRKISVEMKSVNHRYLEAGIKMPKKLNIFEARIRDLLKKYNGTFYRFIIEAITLIIIP